MTLDGPPVLVDPVLMTNSEAKTDLNQRNIVIDGVNGFDFLQYEDNLRRPFDDE